MAIRTEHSNGTAIAGQIPNNNLRETVRNPNGIIMASNDFTGRFFTMFKPDITGKYTVTVYNLGHTPVSVGILVGNLPLAGANNQGVILSITGIIILIAGIIVLILDRSRTPPKAPSPT